jgi:hypothetical protein
VISRFFSGFQKGGLRASGSFAVGFLQAGGMPCLAVWVLLGLLD